MYERILNELIAARELLAEEARELFDSFWIDFTTQNKKIIIQRANGDRELKVSRLAPMLERKKTAGTEKIYLSWRIYDASPLRKKNPKLSRRLNPNDTVNYSKGHLKKECVDWDMEKVWELENNMRRLREQFEFLHKTYVKSAKLKRNYHTPEDEE